MHLNSRLGHRCVLILIVATLAPLNIRAAERNNVFPGRDYREVEGTLTLELTNLQGEQVAAQVTKFRIAALGQETLYNDFTFPHTDWRFSVAGDHSISREQQGCIHTEPPKGQARRAGETAQLRCVSEISTRNQLEVETSFQVSPLFAPETL